MNKTIASIATLLALVMAAVGAYSLWGSLNSFKTLFLTMPWAFSVVMLIAYIDKKEAKELVEDFDTSPIFASLFAALILSLAVHGSATSYDYFMEVITPEEIPAPPRVVKPTVYTISYGNVLLSDFSKTINIKPLSYGATGTLIKASNTLTYTMKDSTGKTISRLVMSPISSMKTASSYKYKLDYFEQEYSYKYYKSNGDTLTGKRDIEFHNYDLETEFDSQDYEFRDTSGYIRFFNGEFDMVTFSNITITNPLKK